MLDLSTMIIEIHPYASTQNNVGLCNKLRTIISYLYYCDINNYKLKVVWDYFYSLFPTILDNSLFTMEQSNISYGPPLFYPLGECNNCEGGCNCDISVDYYSKTFPFEKYFNMLIHNHEIKQTIDSFQNLEHLFGVHIRQTDYIDFSKSNKLFLPTVDDYIKKIDLLLEENDSFYFTTDEPATYKTIKDRYGSKVFYIENKELNRNNVKCFDYAYIDCVLLSKTKFILGNANSSFSYLSSKISNKKLLAYNGHEWNECN
jgi:hypothetical protein